MNNQVSTKEFLVLLFGKCTDGCITITTLPDARTEHIPVQQLDKAAEHIAVHGRTSNTYYGTALRCEGLSANVRGSAGQVHTVVCMYADIDIVGPAHKETHLPQTTEEAITFVNTLKVKPSIIVQSGNGIHAIWLLDVPFIIHNEDEREHIRNVSAGFGIYVVEEGRKNGWKLDNVQDVARMLRTPGTLNFKSDPPKACEVLQAEDIRYPLDVFEGFKRTVEDTVFETSSDAARSILIGPAERMCGRCAFIDDCIQNAAALPEPKWHAFLSIVSITENGQEKAHEWSESYPGYSYDQTQSYCERAIQMNRPCSCRYIRDGLGFECPEQGCGVKGPIVFAYRTKEEQVEMLLSKDLTREEALDTHNILLVKYASEHLYAQYIRLKEKYSKLKISSRDLEKLMKLTAADAASKASTASQDFDKALVLDGIDTEGMILPKGWDVDMKGVRHLQVLDGIPYIKAAFSAPVFITRRLTNVDKEEIRLELAFYCDHHWKKLIALRGDLMDKSKIVKYANQGLPVTSETSKEAVQYIEAFETVNRDNLPTHRQIERMGWIDSKEFFPYHMDSIAVYDGANDESHRIISAVVPHGDKEKWLEMAAKLRTMHAARVMLAASFASVLLYPLQQRPFILHLWANSRSGKTAVLKAAISIYGDPNVLLRSYNSTAVGIERTAAIMQNIPLALDELQSLSMKYENLARMTYMLGNGIGKMRGDRTGGTQNQPTWRNTILSTGEQPITSENSMDGESTRVMELYAPPIDDTDFAREVHQTVAEHYGFAGQMFMDYLFREYALEKDTCRLREAYIAFRDEFTSDYEMIFDKCTSIYRDYAALLSFADYVSSKAVFGADDQKAYGGAWELGVNLLEALKKDAKNDAVERAWTAVNEWVVSNKDHFEVKRGDLPSNNYGTEHEPIYGRYAPKDEKLYILPGALSRMLTNNGFSPEKSVKGFKERGYISGKQEQHRVGKGSVKVIIANIKLDYTQYDPPLLE